MEHGQLPFGSLITKTRKPLVKLNMAPLRRIFPLQGTTAGHRLTNSIGCPRSKARASHVDLSFEFSDDSFPNAPD